ncbi:hypothetical protein GCM10018987_56670 [Streptomyces cremeus]
MWNPTPALSSTPSVRQALTFRRLGAAKADPAWINGSVQRGQIRCRSYLPSYGCLYETRQARQTYEVFPWLMGGIVGTPGGDRPTVYRRGTGP